MRFAEVNCGPRGDRHKGCFIGLNQKVGPRPYYAEPLPDFGISFWLAAS
jgi:hypothetical protein